MLKRHLIDFLKEALFPKGRTNKGALSLLYLLYYIPWCLYRLQVQTLERFHQRCLRSILKIAWHQRITNIAVLEKAGVNSLESSIYKLQLRWLGHVIRMSDARLPKQILYAELTAGTRPK